MDWMSKGYIDGWKGRGPYNPPNHPVDRAAYDHGWRSAEADNGKPRNESFAETCARAEAIRSADAAGLDCIPIDAPQEKDDAK